MRVSGHRYPPPFGGSPVIDLRRWRWCSLTYTQNVCACRVGHSATECTSGEIDSSVTMYPPQKDPNKNKTYIYIYIYIYICSNSRVQNSRLYGRKSNLEFHAVQGGSEFQAVWSKKGVQNSKPSRFRIPGWSKSGVQNFKLQNPLKYWIVLYELLNPLK